MKRRSVPWLLPLLLCPLFLAAATFRGKITRVKSNGIYIDLGSRDGIVPGQTAVLKRKSKIVLKAQVAEVVRSHESRLDILWRAAGMTPERGETMEVSVSLAGGRKVGSRFSLAAVHRPKNIEPVAPEPVLPVPLPVGAPSSSVPQSSSPATSGKNTPPPSSLKKETPPGSVPEKTPRTLTQTPETPSATVAPPSSPAPSSSVVSAAGETLVLLEKPLRRKAETKSANVFHGRLRYSTVINQDPDGASSYTAERVGHNGSIDRLGGEPWALTWQTNTSRRFGPGAVNALDYHTTKWDVYRLALEGKMERTILRLGRFLPTEVAASGLVDGVQVERTLVPGIRTGNVVGFRPSRLRQDLRTDEVAETAYVSLDKGQRGKMFGTMTLGAHTTVYRGKIDRTAALGDIQVDWMSKMNWVTGAEVDFDLNGGERRWSGARLTRLTSFLWMPIIPVTTFRGGVDHFQQTYSNADRAVYQVPADQPLDPGYWRYTGGLNQKLFWDWQADGELSFLRSDQGSTPNHWRGALTHNGLPFFPLGRWTVAAYNIEESDVSNTGYQSNAYVPIFGGTAGVDLALNGRTFRTNDPLNLGVVGPSRGLKITDYTLRVDGFFLKRWNLYGGYTHTFAVIKKNDLMDFGISFRW